VSRQSPQTYQSASYRSVDMPGREYVNINILMHISCTIAALLIRWVRPMWTPIGQWPDCCSRGSMVYSVWVFNCPFDPETTPLNAFSHNTSVRPTDRPTDGISRVVLVNEELVVWHHSPIKAH